jgi:hypothetical protein
MSGVASYNFVLWAVPRFRRPAAEPAQTPPENAALTPHRAEQNGLNHECG